MHTHSQRMHAAVSKQKREWPPRWLRSAPEGSRLARKPSWQPLTWNKRLLLLAVFCIYVVDGTLSRAVAQVDPEHVSSGTLWLHSEAGSTTATRVHTQVSMQITGIIARVEVTQQFHNPSTAWAEGRYVFPLPENAAVDRLRMEIGTRVIEGEIHEKATAQQLYEQARTQGRRASVVHQQRPNLFRTAVANIAPGETIDVRIGYLQVISPQAGRYSLRFPLTVTPRYVPGIEGEQPALNAETLTASATLAVHADDSSTLGDLHPQLMRADVTQQSVTIEIDLDAGAALEHLDSRYHPLVTRSQGRRVTMQLRDGQVPPDRDFELSWMPVVHGEPQLALYREPTDAGEHLLLMFMPPQEVTEHRTARDVVFIIDTSGSMSGESIAQARAALLNGLDALTPRDTFTVIQFNSKHHALFDRPVPASAANLAIARSYVQSLSAHGGTEMYPALLQALILPSDIERLRQIVFITDGAVGNEEQLMSMIRARLGAARMFTVGIGSAPNGYFMRKAAQAGRGTFTYIGSPHEVTARMDELLQKLTQPVLTGIELQWPEGVEPDESLAPIRDLYSGEPVVVTARLKEPARGVLSVSGHTQTSWLRQFSLDTAEPRTGVATLWARMRIEDLMDSRTRGASDNELRARVLPLALQYRLVSNYTSLVAVDRTPARAATEPLLTQRLVNTQPHGLDWQLAAYPSTATPATLYFTVGALLLLLAGAGWILPHRTERRQ